MRPVVLGLDVGTTSAKVAAFDASGDRAGDAEVAYPLDEPGPGEAVQDPVAVVDAVIAAARQAGEEASRAGRRITGLACSTAMHGLVALDAHDRPLTRLLTWADTRAAAQARRLKAEHPDLHARTGTPLHPMAPLAKLVWFREREPATHAAAHRWVGLKELVLHRLTGRWVVDWSMASGTGLLDLEALDWCADALELAGVRREQLAELVPTHQALELTPGAARELGVEASVPVIAGAGDGPLANLGVGAVRPGVAACSIGTSGALRLMTERPVADPLGRVFCFCLTEDRWAVGGSINNGGIVLQWAGQALAPDLGEHAEEELLRLAAQAPAGCDGLVMAPHLLSERAPHWDADAVGAYVGLRRHHGRAHLIRAALEGVCQQLHLVLASLEGAGQEVLEIRATGGFARSPFWRQLLADVLDRPLGFPAHHEGSGFGAALLAMQALGEIDSLGVAADLVRIAYVVEPDARASARYGELLPLFESLGDR